MWEEYYEGNDNLYLMAIGKIAEAGEGCACSMGLLTKLFLDNLKEIENELIIIDTEAGIEHFGRGVDQCVDIIFMVIDPSYESIHLSQKIYEMGSNIGKPVYFILNKMDEDTKRIVQDILTNKEAIIAYIPMDMEIFSSGLKGVVL